MPTTRPVRPLSPHVQVWRWHVTMAASIISRVTAVASVAGIILVACWLVALGLGPAAYKTYLTCAASPFGLATWFLVSLAVFVHLAGGIRHLIWDSGNALSTRSANIVSIISLAAPVVVNVGFWALLILTHKVNLR